MFRQGFVAGLEIEQRKIRVHQRVHGTQAFGFVALADRGGVIAHPTMNHAEPQLGIKMVRLNFEDPMQSAQGTRQIAGAEREHRRIVLVLEFRHNCF